MNAYFCNKCKVKSETSICAICNERTELKSDVYWCKQCNIPMYEERCTLCNNVGERVSSDIRPVFPEERLLLEVLIDEPFKYKDDSVWNCSGNKYIVNGKKLSLTPSKLMKKNAVGVSEQLKELSVSNTYDSFNYFISKFIEANRNRLNYIVSEATDFIIREKVKYGDDESFVSFSGGKDSTVVSDLVIRALGNPNIIHVFGDTTLEFPMTMEYLNRFKKEHNKTPVLVAKNKDKNFYDMCQVIGPPSRVMRWCCIVFKTGAINKKINAAFKNKSKLLTFYGVRRSESTSRSKYERVSDSPKITKQKVVSPIIDWVDFDIWLYLLANNVDFNDAYRLGYSRVGCWCCPNNTEWAQYLSSIYIPDQANRWKELLVNFAKMVGKPDPEDYVSQGGWKARQGGNGVEYSKKTFVEFKPCVNENDSFTYELTKEITEELYEFFKPFGWINKEMGNSRLGQVYVVDKLDNPIIRLQGRIGSNQLKVTILKLPLARAKSLREAKLKIDCQITKYQMCLGCLACESVCKHGAIIVNKSTHKNEKSAVLNNEFYKISDEKCKRCTECINHFDGGCYMRKVLITKRGDK